MDALYRNVYPDRNQITDERRIRLTYKILQNVARNRFYVPCIKRYLNSHLRSKIYMIPPVDWDIALFLPTQKFVKASDSRVWRESANKIRSSGGAL